MVQKLKVHTSTAGDMGLILDWATKISYALWYTKKKKDNNNKELRKRLFVGLSRQEYWSCLPFPSPGDHMLSWGRKESDMTE